MMRAFGALGFAVLLFGFGYVLHAYVPGMPVALQVGLAVLMVAAILVVQHLLPQARRVDYLVWWMFVILDGFAVSWLSGSDDPLAAAGVIIALSTGVGCAVVMVQRAYQDERGSAS